MAPPIFKNMVFATAGPLPGQLTDENLQRWAEQRKGKFSKEFTSEVTHLLCTVEQFRQKISRVKEALLPKNKKIKILESDWFEFSAVNNKRRNYDDYDLRAWLQVQVRKRREMATRELNRRLGERMVNPDLYHIFRDQLNFPYQITLTRQDHDTMEIERYELTLWETHAIPNLYTVTAKFYKKAGDSKPAMHRLSPCQSLFFGQYQVFKSFFETKTGIEWQDRIAMAGVEIDPCLFQYAPPTDGKPVGTGLRVSYDEAIELNTQIRNFQRQAAAEGATAGLKEGAPGVQSIDSSSSTMQTTPPIVGTLGDDVSCELASLADRQDDSRDQRVGSLVEQSKSSRNHLDNEANPEIMIPLPVEELKSIYQFTNVGEYTIPVDEHNPNAMDDPTSETRESDLSYMLRLAEAQKRATEENTVAQNKLATVNMKKPVITVDAAFTNEAEGPPESAAEVANRVAIEYGQYFSKWKPGGKSKN